MNRHVFTKNIGIKQFTGGKLFLLENALPLIKNLLGDKLLNIAFIPFASTDKNYHEYAALVTNAFKDLPYTLNVVKNNNAKEAMEQSDAIMVGGGNSFKLLHDLYEANILDIMREKINAGTPYIGWSAGSNILCSGIYTTNDMPVIEPESFKALSIFPFQINPHYYNIKPEGFNGETRDQRLTEFVRMNPTTPVVCLPEGSALYLNKGILKFIGEEYGVLLHLSETNEIVRKEIINESDLSYLL